MRRNRKASMWSRDDNRGMYFGRATYAHRRGFATLWQPSAPRTGVTETGATLTGTTLTGAARTGPCGGRLHHLQRRWPKPGTVGVALKRGVSGGDGASGGGGAAGANPNANDVGERRREGAGAGVGAVTSVNGRDSSAGDSEPLVEQVATALAQRCGVRGGDL
ncbi:unnamed protein product, partial [Laminaria digitata]